MSERDIMKSWRDLPKSIDFTDGSNWTWGRGGHPLHDWQFFIAYTHDDLHQDVYVLPDYISEMLRRQLENGGNDARRAIVTALGLP